MATLNHHRARRAQSLLLFIAVMGVLFNLWDRQITSSSSSNKTTSTKQHVRDISQQGAAHVQVTAATSPSLLLSSSHVDDNDDNLNDNDKIHDNDFDKDAVAQQYSLCRATELLVNVTGHYEGLQNVSIGTSCDGDAYPAFTTALLQHVSSSSSSLQQHAPTWGRRSHPLPAGQKILAVGSKYMQRLALTMACQATVTSTSKEEKEDATTTLSLTTSRDGLVSRWKFGNDAELWTIIDPYAVWAGPDHWQALLEQQLTNAAIVTTTTTQGIRLADFDALLVGVVQECSVHDTTKYTAKMQAWAQHYPTVDCLTNRPPSIVPDWTAAFAHGPIALVSLPSRDRAHVAQEQVMAMQQYAQRNNNSQTIGLISASHVMDQMETKATTKSGHLSCDKFCLAGSGTSRRPCTGAYGGVTDVVVWDVVEFFHQTAASTTTRPSSSSNSLWYPTTSVATPTCPADDDLWPTPRVCGDQYIDAKPDILATPVKVTYWCQGPQYNAFAQQLHNYASDAASDTWGRRRLPFPSNKRILVIGNSHTRQVTYSLLCQHQAALQAQLYFNGPMRYDFCHNSTVVTVFNSHVPYSHDWKALLEEQVQEPLENFDAVVLGLMNHCGGTNNFSVDMERQTADMDNVDCINIAPPTVGEWAANFNGVIVFVSMFSRNQLDEVEQAREQVELVRTNMTRSNVVFVDARQHVEAIHNECASFNRSGVMDCVLDVGPENDIYNSTHRCVGEQGGHPDLVAWDVVEQLHALLK